MTVTVDPSMALGLNIDELFAVRALDISLLALPWLTTHLQEWDELLNARGTS